MSYCGNHRLCASKPSIVINIMVSELTPNFLIQYRFCLQIGAKKYAKQNICSQTQYLFTVLVYLDSLYPVNHTCSVVTVHSD